MRTNLWNRRCFILNGNIKYRRVAFWNRLCDLSTRRCLQGNSKGIFPITTVMHFNKIHTRRLVTFFFFFFRMQHMAASSIIGWWRGCADDAKPSVGWGRNLELVRGAGNSSPTLHKGHRGIFNVRQLMPADGTPRFNVHPRDGTHTLMPRPTWEMTVSLGPRFKSRLDGRGIRTILPTW